MIIIENIFLILHPVEYKLCELSLSEFVGLYDCEKGIRVHFLIRNGLIDACSSGNGHGLGQTDNQTVLFLSVRPKIIHGHFRQNFISDTVRTVRENIKDGRITPCPLPHLQGLLMVYCVSLTHSPNAPNQNDRKLV